MRPVYILHDNIITSLGFTTREHAASLEKGTIGIKTVDDPALYNRPCPVSLVDTTRIEEKFTRILAARQEKLMPGTFTRLEKMLIISIHDVIEKSNVTPDNERMLLVISTTKGNINLLEDRHKAMFSHKRLYLWELGRIIQQFFGFSNTPVIISNACISGVLAVMYATRRLRHGDYDHAIVTGGDIISEFVVSGFQSFQALSAEPCKPFDLNRTGLSLGEGCGTMLLSAEPGQSTEPLIRVAGGATSNDANHISGPSRTGEELAWAIRKSLEQATLAPEMVSYISAHGTATPFNDEMESKAIGLSGLVHVPVNSFKGYWGHTLGAAGLVESVISIESLRQNYLYRSAGFDTLGVPVPVNIITGSHPANLVNCLKLASGFGGCNAAILYQKD